MIPIPSPNWYIAPYNSKFTQATGFNKGFIAFGDRFGGYTQFNRSLSFATYTETINTPMSTAARIMAMACASPTHVYLMTGYSSTGYVATVNKLTSNTSTESTVNINWALGSTRRGGSVPCPHFNRSRMYIFMGFDDYHQVVSTTISFVTQNTDTDTYATDLFGGARHLAITLFNSVQAHIVGGYDQNLNSTNTNYRYLYATDTYASANNDTINHGQSQGFSSNVAGYRVQGYPIFHTQNTKYTFSNDTWAATTNSPENNGKCFAGSQYVNEYEGALWCGYNDVFAKRLLYRLSWATETYTNSSYTTADVNNGFLFYASGY